MIGFLTSLKSSTSAVRTRSAVAQPAEKIQAQPCETFTKSDSCSVTAPTAPSSEGRQCRTGARAGLVVALALAAGLSGCASLGGGPQGLENYHCVPVATQPAPSRAHHAPTVIVCEPPSVAHELGSGLYNGLLVPIGHQVDNFAHGVAGKPERFH